MPMPSSPDRADRALSGPMPTVVATGRRPLPAAPTGRQAGTGPVPRLPGAAGTASPWFDAFSRSPAQPRTAEYPLPAPPEQRDEQPDASAASTHLGMPVRVPQANLAHQLRDGSGGGDQGAGRPGSDIDERSPERTAAMMISMQQGWERGRVDDLDEPAGAPDNGTDQ